MCVMTMVTMNSSMTYLTVSLVYARHAGGNIAVSVLFECIPVLIFSETVPADADTSGTAPAATGSGFLQLFGSILHD